MMLEEGKISSSQLMLLVITLILSSAILLLPAFPTMVALQDSWISGIIAMFVGLLVAVVILNLAWRFPGQSLAEYSIDILGQPLGKLIGFIYFLFYLHLTAILLREIASTIVSTILPRTPPEVLILLSVIAAAYLVRKGLEVIVRVNTIILPIAVFFIVAIYLMLVKDMQYINLTPGLENGIVPILKGTITPMGWFGEVVSIGFILPYMNKLIQAKKAIYLGIIITGVLFTLVIIGTLAVFGPDLTKNLIFPTFVSVRQVNVANFLERIESVLVASWIVWNFIKIGLFYYITVMILSQLLKLGDYRSVVFPMGAISAILALALFRNAPQLAQFLAVVWGKYAIIFELLIPLLLLFVAIIRGKKGVLNAKE